MPLGTEVGFGPGDIVLDGDPALSTRKGAQQPLPTFRPISVVAKRSPAISATAELLFKNFIVCTLRLSKFTNKLECEPMPNVMAALPNIGGALCSTPQSLADAL